MSHVSDLYRDEAMGFITSREFDRRFDDAVEQDLIEARQRDYEAEKADYYAEAEREYIEDMLNSMNPHDRKHALNPMRIDLKGGHHHNQWKNAMARMRKCHICGAPIVKGCEVVSQNGWNEFQCRTCWTDDNIEQACLVGIPFGGMIYKVRKFRRH